MDFNFADQFETLFDVDMERNKHFCQIWFNCVNGTQYNINLYWNLDLKKVVLSYHNNKTRVTYYLLDHEEIPTLYSVIIRIGFEYCVIEATCSLHERVTDMDVATIDMYEKEEGTYMYK